MESKPHQWRCNWFSYIMDEPETIEKITANMPKYWDGTSNRLVRYWVYLDRGLSLVNQARYLILGILGLYAVLKLTDPAWMAVMFVVSVPSLIVMGRWHLYRVSKPQEFINNTRGSIVGYRSYNLSIETLETLKQIRDKLT